MSNRVQLLAVLSAAVVGACVGGRSPVEPTRIAVGTVTASDGSTVGKMELLESSAGIRLRVDVSGLPGGEHGMHLHAVGRCEGPAFTSAAGHLNPHQKQHGTQNTAGSHLGDLPNLTVRQDGTGSAEITLDEADRSALIGYVLDSDGTALVIHAGADDHRTDPAGNSGARIACGVLAPAMP